MSAIQQSLFDDFEPGFWDWLENNSDVAAAFERTAIRGYERGKRNWSARGILQVLRWESDVRECEGEPFKINNRWSRSLAKWFVRNHPDKSGFFRFRDGLGRDE